MTVFLREIKSQVMFEGTCGISWTFQSLWHCITHPTLDSSFRAVLSGGWETEYGNFLVSLFFCFAPFSAHQAGLKKGSPTRCVLPGLLQSRPAREELAFIEITWGSTTNVTSTSTIKAAVIFGRLCFPELRN